MEVKQKSLNEYEWWCNRIGKTFKSGKINIDLEFAKWDMLRTDEFDSGEWREYDKLLKEKYDEN